MRSSRVPEQRTKVLRVIARLNMGGPALHVAYLASGLREHGYDTTLVAGSLARGEDSMEFVADELGVKVERLPGLRRDISPIRDVLAVLRLAQLIKRERPTIMHTHTAKAGAVGRLAALVSGDARPPIVVHTFHGHVLRGYFGPLRTLGFRLLERWLARGTDALVAVSPEVRDDLVRLGVAPREKFTVVRLGIELEERLGGASNGRDETRRVLGDGPEREQVEQRAHDLGIMRDTLFLGYQENVAPFYSAFDAMILPSGNEGTPVSAMESLAAGRPVVATRVGGVPDVVRDGEDGFLVELGDVRELAGALARLADDPELRVRMGEAGRARVLPRYAVQRLVDDVDRLYRALLAA